MKTLDSYKSRELLMAQNEPRSQTKMKKADEEHCLSMIMNPDFVHNLKILQ